MIHDITNPEFSKDPDDIPEFLAYGDKLGRYVNMRMFWVEGERPDIQTDVMMCYVASIQPDKKFKVYYAFSERSDFTYTAEQGLKLRDEKIAHQLFPMLTDYELMR